RRRRWSTPGSITWPESTRPQPDRQPAVMRKVSVGSWQEAGNRLLHAGDEPTGERGSAEPEALLKFFNAIECIRSEVMARDFSEVCFGLRSGFGAHQYGRHLREAQRVAWGGK